MGFWKPSSAPQPPPQRAHVVLSEGSAVLCKETLGSFKITGLNDVNSLLAAMQNSVGMPTFTPDAG